MNEAKRRVLRRLKKSGAAGIARSAIPKSALGLVEELVTAGAARWRTSSHGRSLVVTEMAAFEAICDAHFPLGLREIAEAPEDRASAVALLGNAKRAPRGRCEGAFIRSARHDATLISEADGARIAVGELTALAGGAGILLDPARRWSFAGSVAVVENAEAFWRHDCVLDVDMAVYTVGRMSARLLEWLASPPMERCRYVHWGDYDPVGAAEYLRLAERCGERVTTYVPDSLDMLVGRYGKPELISNQIRVLESLREHARDPVVLRLIAIWERHRRGLEQEILLSNPQSEEGGSQQLSDDRRPFQGTPPS